MKHYVKIKRLIDFISAFLLTVVFSPLFLAVALLIKTADKGEVLFKQSRPGKNCKIFTIYKFKTMIKETEKNGKPLSDMERMTKLGAFLRKTSIDELPQLINILKGDMSFIGPRPLLVRYLGHYTPEQSRRHEVLPGISGWAQVNGRNGITWDERFKLDVWYVDNMSFCLDIKIFIMTVKNILTKKGINASNNETMPFFDEN